MTATKPHAGTVAGQVTPQTTEIRELRECIEWIHCLAADALGDIAGIAQVALAYMELPEAYQHHENIAHVLHMVWEKAQLADSNIATEARLKGCANTDEAQRRRMAASFAARNGGAA